MLAEESGPSGVADTGLEWVATDRLGLAETGFRVRAVGHCLPFACRLAAVTLPLVAWTVWERFAFLAGAGFREDDLAIALCGVATLGRGAIAVFFRLAGVDLAGGLDFFCTTTAG